MRKTIRRGAMLFVLLLASGCAGPVIEYESPSEPLIAGARHRRFRVMATAVPVKIRHDLPLSEIARLPGAARPGLRTQGLTLIRHSLATHTRFRTVSDERKVSAWFDDVILELRLSSVTIHIPREYRESSCEYKAVLLHETGHVAQARRSVAAAARRLEAALAPAEGLPSSVLPLTAADFESAAEALRVSIAHLIDPIYDGYEKSEAEAQSALDTPDPYDVVYRSCSGWK